MIGHQFCDSYGVETSEHIIAPVQKPVHTVAKLENSHGFHSWVASLSCKQQQKYLIISKNYSIWLDLLSHAWIESNHYTNFLGKICSPHHCCHGLRTQNVWIPNSLWIKLIPPNPNTYIFLKIYEKHIFFVEKWLNNAIFGQYLCW